MPNEPINAHDRVRAARGYAGSSGSKGTTVVIGLEEMVNQVKAAEAAAREAALEEAASMASLYSAALASAIRGLKEEK